MTTLILIFKTTRDAEKVHAAVDDLRNGKKVHDGLLRDRLSRTVSGTLSNPEETPAPGLRPGECGCPGVCEPTEGNPGKIPSHTPSAERESKIRKLASDRLSKEGDLEFDDNSNVSEGNDNGAYVQCWKWIDFTGSALDKQT